MNSRQKEVQQSLLNDEQEIINRLKAVYSQASKDCEEKIRQLSTRSDMENLQSVIYQKRYQEVLKKQIDDALLNLQNNEYSNVDEYLNNCYTNGFTGTLYDLHGQGVPLLFPIDQSQVVQAVQLDSKISNGLYTRMGEDVDKLKGSIRSEVSRGIANGSTWNQTASSLAFGMTSPFNKAYNNAVRIVRTEGHRIQNQAQSDTLNKAKAKGADVVKQWDSTLDDVTRDTHKALDGQIKEIDEPFEVGGLSAMQPGGFGDPAEDCNCRCCMLQRAKWALDESELKELQDRADYFGLDKTEDFEDFKNKYLNAVANSGESGIMKLVRYYSGIADKISEFKAKIKAAITPEKYKPVSTEYLSSLPKTKNIESIEQALKATNPNGYNDNCQRCVPAYEMRRRGYAVVALGSPENPFDDNIGLYDYQKVFVGAEWITCKGTGKKEITEFLRKCGDGARVEIAIATDKGSHIFVAEQIGEKTIFIDPQKNLTSVENYFDMNLLDKTKFCRMDNLNLSMLIKDCVKGG